MMRHPMSVYALDMQCNRARLQEPSKWMLLYLWCLPRPREFHDGHTDPVISADVNRSKETTPSSAGM